MVKKLNPVLVRRILEDKEIFIFSPLDFQRIFEVSSSASQKFLARQTKKGFLTKLRAGLYTLTDNFPPACLIANKLYQPSYLSLEWALSHYHLIPETVYTLTSVTPKATREFQVRGLLYLYRKIKKRAFSGYHPEKIGEETILVAEPEKALVDYLYFLDLQKREPNRRLDLSRLSKEEVLNYARVFERKGVNKLIKAVYDFSEKPRRIRS